MIIAFIATIVVSYVIAYGVARPAVSFFLGASTQKIQGNVALFVGMCMFTGINYLGQRFFVFKSKQA
jgi:putative flippase GtrA